jgi:hypothetical protein
MPNVPGLRCTRIEQSQLLKEGAKGDPGLVGILVLNHELRSLWMARGLQRQTHHQDSSSQIAACLAMMAQAVWLVPLCWRGQGRTFVLIVQQLMQTVLVETMHCLDVTCKGLLVQWLCWYCSWTSAVLCFFGLYSSSVGNKIVQSTVVLLLLESQLLLNKR